MLRSKSPSLPGLKEHPLRDALIVAALVFASFALSAFLVLWQSSAREMERVKAAVENAAWKAAAFVSSSVKNLESLEPAPHERSQLDQKMVSLMARESTISRMTLFRPDEDSHAVVMSSDGNINDDADEETTSTPHPQDEEAPHIAQTLQTGEGRIASDDGRVRGFAPVLSANGKPVGVVSAECNVDNLLFTKLINEFTSWSAMLIGLVLSGIVGFLVYTSRKRSHQNYELLAQAEQRIRDVTDAAGEYIWEVDENCNYTFLSQRVIEVLGYTPEEMLGQSLFAFIPPGDLDEVKPHLKSITSERENFTGFELRAIRKDGKIIWLSLNGVPVVNDDVVLTGYRGAGMDITQTKEANQALIREKEAAQAAAVAKSQFLAMMSHEIRTPLNSVIGFADLMTKTPLNAEQKDCLNMISKNGDVLLGLLNDVLDFSKLESGTLPLNFAPIDIRAFLSEIIDLYRNVARDKGVELRLEIAEDVPTYMESDEARLRQILLNLVGNAVKFTDKGHVLIRANREQRSSPRNTFPLRIEVEDTGIGIPTDKQHLLFKPFSQVDSTTTRRFGGTGLGLAICQRLAELLTAKVELCQSSAAGSTFAISMTASMCGATPKPLVPARKAKTHIASNPDLRVLVVEDNRSNRKLTQIMLSSLGLKSDFAENGAEGLRKHRQSPYHLILMDLQMPVLDGLEASAAIRRFEKLNPEISPSVIIAITADALSGDRERCIRAGMDDYLSKPLKAALLAATLEGKGIITRLSS